MSTYGISMDCPHATKPDVLWRVIIRDVDHGDLLPDADHRLWVPHLDTWTLDTVRMVLYELCAYLPAHGSDDVDGGVVAKWERRGGRKPAVPRAPRLNDHVELWVRARGWQAEVWTWNNERTPPSGASLPFSPGSWSQPMAAALVELAAKSPFRIDPVNRVLPGDPVGARLWPSRLCVLTGEDPPFDETTKEYDFDAMELTRRVRRRLSKGR